MLKSTPFLLETSVRLPFRFLIAALSVFAAPALMTAQATTPSTPQPQASGGGTYTLSVKTQLVVLDVVVTDRSGKVVSGLSRDDFEIYENDMKQNIRSFDRPEAHVLPSTQKIESTAELDKQAPEAPVSIIVLDEMNTKFEDEYFARYSLKKYLSTQGDQLSQPTMLVAVDFTKFNVLRDYTTSKKEILDALDHHLARYNWQAAGGGKSWGAEAFQAAFNALIQVAQATEGHPGHKNMIWIGRGFPYIDITAMMPDDQEALQDAMQTCTNLLRDARVTLYTVDPAGVKSGPTETDENGMLTDDPFGGDVNFTTVAQATGGKAFFGRNDVDNLIGTSFRNGQQFYTLTYSPREMSDDPKQFRKIRVVMKNPLYKAVAREGYFPDAPPPPPMLDGKPSPRLVYDLSLAAQSMMVYDGVPITVTRDEPTGDKFTVHIEERGIQWKDNGDQPRTADIAVLVASFDKKGKLLERNAQTMTAQAPAQAPGTVPQPRAINIHTKIATAPPAARVRVVVRVASSGKVGAENILLVDKKELKDPTSYTPRSDRRSQRRR